MSLPTGFLLFCGVRVWGVIRGPPWVSLLHLQGLSVSFLGCCEQLPENSLSY